MEGFSKIIMNNEIIDISFDDDSKGETGSQKKIIDIEIEEHIEAKKNKFINEIPEPEVHAITESDIAGSVINSYYRGNPALTGRYNSDMEYPEGIGISFRKKFISLLKDEFLNGLLENNKYIAASSRDGNIYLTDRSTGVIKHKLSPANSVFEKTGVVIENCFYINSVKSIYEVKSGYSDDKENISIREIYTASTDFFIWSNLNAKSGKIFFNVYNPSTGKAAFVSLDISDQTYYEYEFIVEKDLSDSICLAGDVFCFFYDNNLVKYTSENNTEEISLNINLNFSFPVLYLNFKLFCVSELNEIYYCDLNERSFVWKFTGIKADHVTSLIGCDDNLFIGTISGWRSYKTSGTEIFSFEEDSEMKIECVSKNLLTASKGNKIIFYNLKRFTEAEGYITGTGNKETGEIKSAIISFNNIFLLTAKGTLECYTADNLNIHI